MKANARLIKNIAHAHKSGTNLRCQTDTLCFPAGQGSRCSRKRQVIQPDIHKESDPGPDLLQYLLSNDLLLCGKLHIL